MPLTPDERADLAARYLALGEKIAELGSERDEIAATLRADGPGRHQAGEHVVEITQAKRFDPAVAAVVLPADMLATITVPRVDGETAKRLLPPAAYAACQAPWGKPRVSVR